MIGRIQHGHYSHDYFCLDDEEISLDHTWKISTTPPCGSHELSFYHRNSCFANSVSQIDDIFLRYAKSRAASVQIKISGGVMIPQPADRFLADRLLKMAASVGRSIRIQYLWNAKLQCFYAKIL